MRKSQTGKSTGKHHPRNVHASGGTLPARQEFYIGSTDSYLNRSGKAPKRENNTFAHCCGCDLIQRDMPERKNTRGRRVVFHTRACFNLYLDRNRPQLKVPLDDARVIAARLQQSLDTLRTETLWFRPSDHRRFVNEEIIFQLESILTGHERVTMQERAVPSEIMMAARSERHTVRTLG